MPDRDFLRRVAIGIVGQKPAELIVERHLALLDQLANGHLGKGLVDRSEVELCIDAVWYVVFLAGQTAGLLEDWLVSFGEQHGAGELVSAGKFVETAFDQRKDLRFGQRGWSFVFRDVLRRLDVLDV